MAPLCPALRSEHREARQGRGGGRRGQEALELNQDRCGLGWTCWEKCSRRAWETTCLGQRGPTSFLEERRTPASLTGLQLQLLLLLPLGSGDASSVLVSGNQQQHLAVDHAFLLETSFSLSCSLPSAQPLLLSLCRFFLASLVQGWPELRAPTSSLATLISQVISCGLRALATPHCRQSLTLSSAPNSPVNS